ncbi:MAG: type II toxin-antitoxin system VapC family toxin [Proteobacteria bacterium]|nr:type II toxin-antitoxin system VapC family toxin [Pseudomonadota bacterium]
MKFWDSSALVPLFVPEPESKSIMEILKADQVIMVWALTPVEILSALGRKFREGAIDRNTLSQAKSRLKGFERVWMEVKQLDLVRDRAERLLAVHLLRAGDSLQLAAALVGFSEQTEGIGFVTLDRNLAGAAEKEGFAVEGILL